MERQLPVPGRGSQPARGSRRCPRRRGRKPGPRRCFGKLDPALQSLRGPLVALRLLRTSWATVLPAQGTFSRVPGGELGALGIQQRGPGATGDPAGREDLPIGVAVC